MCIPIRNFIAQVNQNHATLFADYPTGQMFMDDVENVALELPDYDDAELVFQNRLSSISVPVKNIMHLDRMVCQNGVDVEYELLLSDGSTIVVSAF